MVSTVAGQPVNSQPVDRRWDPTAVRGVRSRSKYRFRTPNGVKAQTGIDAVKVADCTSGEPWQGGHANPYMWWLKTHKDDAHKRKHKTFCTRSWLKVPCNIP